MFFRILCGILAIVALGAGRAEDYSDIVRLHVIANSDCAADQEFKLQVRDAVLEEIAPMLEGCASSGEVFEALCSAEGQILAAALSVGGDMPIRVETGIFEFDERQYGGETVPAGEYRAMRVIIGDGNGRNWWGIMFPQAMPIETDEDTVYYSAVLEWIFGLFGRDL